MNCFSTEENWNFSWSLYHGPTDGQLQQALKALEREECSAATLFFSLHEEDEDGGLTHVSSLIAAGGQWLCEGTQWCKDIEHPEGWQSPVRITWKPAETTGIIEMHLPELPKITPTAT